MELSELQDTLSRIEGCTFATLDALTEAKSGITRVTTGERVILFTNKRSSGYENMVRRRLQQAGLDPDGFRLGDLPWGERMPETPIIVHKGKYYLQTITLEPGAYEYFLGRHVVDPMSFGIKPPKTKQGLPPGKEVLVATYALENITRLVLMGQVFEGRFGKLAKFGQPSAPEREAG